MNKFLITMLILFSSASMAQDCVSGNTQENNDCLFKKSLTSMKSFRRRMFKCGYTDSNMALFRKKIIKDKDISKRDCLFSHTGAIKTEDAQLSLEKSVRKDCEFAQEMTIKFIALERAGNSGLSPLQRKLKVKRTNSKLKSVKSLLSTCYIEGVMDEISDLSTDADFPSTAKTYILNYIDSYLE